MEKRAAALEDILRRGCVALAIFLPKLYRAHGVQPIIGFIFSVLLAVPVAGFVAFVVSALMVHRDFKQLMTREDVTENLKKGRTNILLVLPFSMR